MTLAGVLEHHRRSLGPDDAATLATAYNLASARLGLGRPSEAERMLRAALAVYEEKLPDSWERFLCQGLLGTTLAAQKKYAEAEPLLLAGYQGMLQRETQLPLIGPLDVERVEKSIVRLYQAWDKPEKAAEWEAKLHSRLAASKKS